MKLFSYSTKGVPALRVTATGTELDTLKACPEYATTLRQLGISESVSEGSLVFHSITLGTSLSQRMLNRMVAAIRSMCRENGIETEGAVLMTYAEASVKPAAKPSVVYARRHTEFNRSGNNLAKLK